MEQGGTGVTTSGANNWKKDPENQSQSTNPTQLRRIYVSNESHVEHLVTTYDIPQWNFQVSSNTDSPSPVCRIVSTAIYILLALPISSILHSINSSHPKFPLAPCFFGLSYLSIPKNQQPVFTISLSFASFPSAIFLSAWISVLFYLFIDLFSYILAKDFWRIRAHTHSSLSEVSWNFLVQPKMNDNVINPLPLTSLNHISIVCKSVEKSIDFYTNVLGFVPIRRPGSFNFDGAW